MKSGIGYLFIFLALGAVLSYARPNMELPREKRGIKIGGNNHGDIHAPCTAVVCNKKKREIQMNTENVETSETNAQIPENQDFDENSNLDSEKVKDPEVSINLGDPDISREKRGIKIGGNNNGDIHAPCTAVVCNKKKRSVNIGNDNDGSIYAPENPVNIGRDNNGEIDSNPDIVKIGGRNNGRVRDPKANNHFNF